MNFSIKLNCTHSLDYCCAEVKSSEVIFSGFGKADYQLPRTLFVRWDEKAGIQRDAIRSQCFDVLKAQRNGDRLMKKNSTVAVGREQILKQARLTIGLDRTSKCD